MKIYPLMPGYIASKYVSENVLPNINDLKSIRDAYNPSELKKKCLWIPVGDRVSWDEVDSIRSGIEDATARFITQNPYPKNFQYFDQLMYPVVHSYLSEMTPSMAGRLPTWNLFNVGLCPDIVTYRWRSQGKETLNVKDRFFGTTRNYFGVIWWRTYFFYDKENGKDPFGILNSLNEDDFVQIMERVRLRGYPDLALTLGRKIADLRKSIKLSSYPVYVKDLIIRHFIMDIRVQALSLDFVSLKQDNKLSLILDETCERIASQRLSEFDKSQASFLNKYKKIITS